MSVYSNRVDTNAFLVSRLQYINLTSDSVIVLWIMMIYVCKLFVNLVALESWNHTMNINQLLLQMFLMALVACCYTLYSTLGTSEISQCWTFVWPVQEIWACHMQQWSKHMTLHDESDAPVLLLVAIWCPCFTPRTKRWRVLREKESTWFFGKKKKAYWLLDLHNTIVNYKQEPLLGSMFSRDNARSVTSKAVRVQTTDRDSPSIRLLLLVACTRSLGFRLQMYARSIPSSEGMKE
jgi:hypothetical protein